ncbi:MAG: nuclear transport factor 2 family protein [Chitinophagaceae bacterium]|nr:nuclear transport factor 2 family protein [Chitinophagaceae bacterium]
MKHLVIAALFSVVILNVSAQDKKQEVEQAVNALRQAMLDGDSLKLDQLTESELTYGHSLGKVENKQQFVSALASGQSDFESLEISDQTIAVKNKTAWVRHIITARVTDNGKMNDVKLSVLLVFVKDSKQWKLLARQAVRLQG